VGAPAIPALFAAMCDDASMFPPGNAPVAEAVPAHRVHRAAWYARLAGPFLLGADRIAATGAAAGTEPLDLLLRPGAAAVVELRRGPGLEAALDVVASRDTGRNTVPAASSPRRSLRSRRLPPSSSAAPNVILRSNAVGFAAAGRLALRGRTPRARGRPRRHQRPAAVPAGPGLAAGLLRGQIRDDDRDLLPLVKAPALITSGTIGPEVPADVARYLRQRIPYVRPAEIPAPATSFSPPARTWSTRSSNRPCGWPTRRETGPLAGSPCGIAMRCRIAVRRCRRAQEAPRTAATIGPAESPPWPP
jgi:pimeloyl-ACP methyl ester carboxylesterase